MKVINKEKLMNDYNEFVKDRHKIDNITIESLIDEIRDKIIINDYINGEETQFEISCLYTKSEITELMSVTYDSGWEYSEEKDDMVEVREETIIF